jgi:hypothetical protein
LSKRQILSFKPASKPTRAASAPTTKKPHALALLISFSGGGPPHCETNASSPVGRDREGIWIYVAGLI